MKTSYQRLLEMLSRAEKGDFTVPSVMGAVNDFLNDIKKGLESPLEVKRVAAAKKLADMIKIFEELKEAGAVQEDTSHLSEVDQRNLEIMKEDIDKKMNEVKAVYNKQRGNHE